MSLPVLVSLDAYRGDTWSQQFRFLTAPDTPLDLSNATVAAKAIAEATGVLIDLAPVKSDPGVVTISLPLDAAAGPYRYDIEVITADSRVTTWVYGPLTVGDDVT
jgi:hypothetical protein